MTNIVLKLMALMAMSFFISTNTVIADDESGEVKKEKAQVISSVRREIHKHALGLGLGQTFLLGNLEKKGDDKITADILYSYTASLSFDLLINAHFSSHSYKEKKVWLRGYSMSIKGRSYEFDAFSPFLIGGVGFYMPQIHTPDGTSDEKYTFGLNGGGGVDLQLNDKIVVGLLAQYHHPFEIKQDETENVRGSYFKLLLTAMYIF